MKCKLNKIIGLKKEEFDTYALKKEIKLRPARLITAYKLGHEMALTSVLLSGLRLIREFRRMVLAGVNMSLSGQVHVYTEVTFPEFPDYRIDGLILVVKGGLIKDAALCEMKNGKSELEKEQIENYQKVAKYYSIPRLITVSNQFVSEPTQFPLAVRSVKGVDLYHYSWAYILTLAHVLLYDNDTNIEDADQVEIMKEVVSYLENPNSGVCGFSQMSKGWSETVGKINTGAPLKVNDPDIRGAVISWQQEEKDLALILSRRLGLLVETGETKYKGNLIARRDDDVKNLIESKQLCSTLKVRGAVSDVTVLAGLDKRTVEMSVCLKPPQDKKIKGQLGWMKRQLESCPKMKNNGLIFAKIKDELLVEIWLKKIRQPERVAIDCLDEVYDKIFGREIKEFRVICHKDFGKRFSSRTIFIDIIEKMAVDFYAGIIQHLFRWEPPVPRMVSSKPKENSNIMESPVSSHDGSLANESSNAVASEEHSSRKEIPTAPCPLCQGALVLESLQVGWNTCPHCQELFEAG